MSASAHPCAHPRAYLLGEGDLSEPEDSWRWVCPDCGAQGAEVQSYEHAAADLQRLTQTKH